MINSSWSAGNRSKVIGAAVVVAVLILLHPRASWAFIDDFGYDWTIWWRAESLASQEEAAREPGRQQRRAEVEQQLKKASAEHEAYFDSVLEASQAAVKSPQGAYYRLPGYVSREAPRAGAKACEVGGVTYLYDQGIFWLQQGTQYVVVTAPFGAIVNTLPVGVTALQAAQKTIFYYFGTFFEEQNGSYQVIKPPAGLVVFYLPEGYIRAKVNGTDYFKFGEIYFQPVFIQGVLFYKVAEV